MPGVATEVLTTNERLVWLRLAAARMRDTYVALAYGPVDGKGQQRQQCEHWWAELSEKQVGKYGRKGDVVVMGDLNACVVGDSKVNDNGRRLLELVEEHELVILNTEHARTKDVAGRGGQERLHHRLHPGAAAGSGSRGVDAGERRRRAGRRRSPSRASGVAYRTYKPARASATGGAAAAAVGQQQHKRRRKGWKAPRTAAAWMPYEQAEDEAVRGWTGQHAARAAERGGARVERMWATLMSAISGTGCGSGCWT